MVLLLFELFLYVLRVWICICCFMCCVFVFDVLLMFVSGVFVFYVVQLLYLFCLVDVMCCLFVLFVFICYSCFSF